jgi:hypothetical protein
MKKQKMLKLTAFPSNPAIENAFSAPVTHSGEISVVFRGRDISIHGWDGSSWSMIYTWNSIDPQFKFNNTYQSYYLKSLNGSEETINVSFFSTQSYQGSTPLLVGVDRGTKLYDIDEVPIYTADDHNKMLTVMSNGSLAWLLANESFIVPSEGGGDGGGGGASYPIVNSMITDSSTFSTYYGATITPEDTLKIGTHGSSMLRTTDQSTDNAVLEDTTITMWVKSTSTQNGASILRFGNWSSGDLAKGVYISMSTRLGRAKTSAGNAIMSSYSNGYFIIKVNNDVHNGSNAWRYKTYFAIPTNIRDGEWHQIVFQFLNVGAGLGVGKAKVYVDGVKINDSFRDNGNIQQDSEGLQVLSHNPIDTARSGWITLGSGFGNNSEFAGFTIEDQVLTEEQIESKYDDSPYSYTPTGTGSFLEDFTMFGGGTVTDGVLSTDAANPSYYKKSGMTAPSTTATTAVFSMWFNPEQSQMGLYSDQHYPSQVDFGLRMFSSSLLHISTPVGGANGVTLATPLTLNEWHHALVTVETDIAYTSTSSKSMTVKLFIDGEEVYTKTGNSSTKRIRAYAGISNGTKHYIGAENYNGSVSYKGDGQFDFMEWVDDVTLSDAQILAMYNGGTRGWSVADADNYTP